MDFQLYITPNYILVLYCSMFSTYSLVDNTLASWTIFFSFFFFSGNHWAKLWSLGSDCLFWACLIGLHLLPVNSVSLQPKDLRSICLKQKRGLKIAPIIGIYRGIIFGSTLWTHFLRRIACIKLHRHLRRFHEAMHLK